MRISAFGGVRRSYPNILVHRLSVPKWKACVRGRFSCMITRMTRHLLLALGRRFSLRRSLQNTLQDRRIWQASALLLVANSIVTVLGLIRTPVITWLIPKDEVGMLGVVGSWIPFLQLCSLSGLDSAAYNYIAKGQPWAFIVTTIYRLRWSLISSMGFLLGAIYWAWREQSGIAWIFVVTGIGFPLAIGMTASAGMLGAQERFRGLFWYRIFESLTDFAGFIPLAFSVWWISRVLTFYASNQIATGIMQLSVTLWLIRQVRRSDVKQMQVQQEREMIRYGKHLTTINGISVLQARSDALLVGLFMPLGTVADYSIAMLVYEQIRRLWGIFIAIRYPKLVRMPTKHQRRHIVLEGGMVWGGLITIGIVIAFLAQWLIPITLPKSYVSSLGYMNILIGTVLVGVPGGLAETYFRAQQDESNQYKMRLIAAAVGVIAPSLLIIRWAAYGAAYGRLLANLTLSILGIWLFVREPITKRSTPGME